MNTTPEIAQQQLSLRSDDRYAMHELPVGKRDVLRVDIGRSRNSPDEIRAAVDDRVSASLAEMAGVRRPATKSTTQNGAFYEFMTLVDESTFPFLRNPNVLQIRPAGVRTNS